MVDIRIALLQKNDCYYPIRNGRQCGQLIVPQREFNSTPLVHRITEWLKRNPQYFGTYDQIIEEMPDHVAKLIPVRPRIPENFAWPLRQHQPPPHRPLEIEKRVC